MWKAQLFAVGSALFFSFSDLAARRGLVAPHLPKVGSDSGRKMVGAGWMAAYLSAGVNTLLFSTAVAVLGWRASGGNTSLRPEALIWFVSAGFFGPFLARLLNYSSIRSVGASRTSPLVAVSPVFTALLAVAFLNEEADLRLWLGTVLIVVGTMIVAPAYRERPR